MKTELKPYDQDALAQLQTELNAMNPVDLADIFEDLSAYDIAIRIKLLKKELLADTFAELNKEKKMEIIEALSDDHVRSLIKELDEDEVVDTLQELPANMTKRLMEHLIHDDRREAIQELLGYAENSVGSIMSVNFVSIRESKSPEDALNRVLYSELDASKLELVWLTDESLILKGYVFLADLLRYPDRPLNDLAYPIITDVYANEDQEVIAQLAYKYSLAEIPVTDSEGRLVGTVPAEWAIEVMYDEYTEDMENISGITSSSEESYLDQSSWTITKDRTTWLVICLITATLTGFIIHRYEDVLASVVVLTVYIPMLMDAGGNAGTQASTTVIRSLFTGEVGYLDAAKVLFKELKIGFMVGLAMVTVNMIRIAMIDSVNFAVNLTVSITLLMTIILSNLIGGVLPLIAQRLKIDPTVMAGPIITTIVDTVVLMIYFEVASLLLNL